MAPVTSEPVAVAVLARAPVAAQTKTRLIPALGADGAAALQERLIEQAIETACAAAVGPLTLWVTAAPHPCFTALASRHRIALAVQPEGDLGVRMLAACQSAGGSAIVIGTDCPVLTPKHLREAAQVLREGTDVVVIPAEDGGYVLIGSRTPRPGLFADMPWSSDTVMAETRRRLTREGLAWREPVMLWDVDRPEDLVRLRAAGLGHLLDGVKPSPPAPA
jgi:uncharacterized protein